MTIEIPQDILKRDAKIMGQFTARQIICTAIGLGVGALIGFVILQKAPTNVRIIGAFIGIFPFVLVGFVRIYEQPIEKILPILINDNFILPAVRVYKAENLIEDSDLIKLDMERANTGGKKDKSQPTQKRGKMAIPSRTIKGIR